MPQHIWLFYVVFLSQVFLLSIYLPRQVLGRMRYVLDTCPPATHPKLYPVSIDALQKAQRRYRDLNVLALLAGLALVITGVYFHSEELLTWDTQFVLGFYTGLQFCPLLLLERSGFKYLKLMRQANSGTTRRADLHPRRLFKFVSPATIGLAVLTYLAFVLLVVYIQQNPFSGFGGYWNVFAITATNLLLAAFVFRSLSGKKADPYQAHEDRLRQMERLTKMAAFMSIAGTVFVALTLLLPALELRHLTDTFMSLYMQLLPVVSFSVFRIDKVDFGVYKKDPLVA